MIKNMWMIGLVMMLVGAAQPVYAEEGVELVYVEWAETVASTNVVKTVLEDMDYEVDTLSVSAAAMWMGTASGDVDGFTGAWLPVTQGEYWAKLKGRVDFLGKNLVGAKIGLAVPAYVEIDSIDQLPAEAKVFDSEIVGIDPGAGIMHKTEKAVEAYGL